MSDNSESDERSPLLSSRHVHEGSREQPEQARAEEEPSNVRITVIMGIIWIGVFLGALDSTIVATLSAPISDSFDSFTLLSWVASSYLIANAALMPLFGRLTDIFGRRAGLIISNVLFGVGNLICGVAQSAWVLIFGRVVAGLGGGGLMAISTFAASDLVPLRRRGLWQGIGNVFYGLGSGLGGIFGGWMNDVYNWRFAFLLQVPLTAISTFLVFWFVTLPVPATETSKFKRVDYWGALALLTSLVLLLVGLNSGGTLVPWTHWLVLTTLPLSMAFLLLFIYVEHKVAQEPIIPVHLLLHRTVACACLTNWFTTMSTYALLYYVPIYFQIRGYTAAQAGLRLVPTSIGGAFASLATGFVMRLTGKYYYLNILMETLLVAGSGLVAATFNRNTPNAPPYVWLLLTGMGYPGQLVITLLALISAVDHGEQAVVTSASYAFRSTGSVIGITLASAVFQNSLKNQLLARFAGRKDAADIIARLRDTADAIKTLPDGWYDGVIDSYMHALTGVWVTVLGLAVLGALVSLGMREHILHSTLSRGQEE